MLLRSSSVPSLGALASQYDSHDSFPSSHCSSGAPLGIITPGRASFSSRPSLPMRRACSEADLQSFHCVADATDHHHNAEEQTYENKHQVSLSVFSRDGEYIQRKECSIVSLTNQVCKFCASSCLYPVAEVESIGPFLMTGELSTPPRSEVLLASSDGGFNGTSGNGNGHVRSDGLSGSPYGGDSDLTDLHYRKLLQSDPQNPLLLRNYAQYLSETKHEHKKAEEYYERAILACPGDGEVLSTYAQLVWYLHKDVERAGSYFEQAVNATPEDCYVLGSYASFLWQCDEDEETTVAGKPEYPSFHGTSTAVMASA